MGDIFLLVNNHAGGDPGHYYLVKGAGTNVVWLLVRLKLQQLPLEYREEVRPNADRPGFAQALHPRQYFFFFVLLLF